MKIQKVLLMVCAVGSGSIKAGKLDGANAAFLDTDLRTALTALQSQTRLVDNNKISNIDDVVNLADGIKTKLSTNTTLSTMAAAFEAVQKAWTPATPDTLLSAYDAGDLATNIIAFSGANKLGATDVGTAMTAIQESIVKPPFPAYATNQTLQGALTLIKSSIDATQVGTDVVISDQIVALQSKIGYAAAKNLDEAIDAAVAAVLTDPKTGSLFTGIGKVSELLTPADPDPWAVLNEEAKLKGLEGLSELELGDTSMQGTIAKVLKLLIQLGNAGGLGVLDQVNTNVLPVNFDAVKDVANMFNVMNTFLTVRAAP